MTRQHSDRMLISTVRGPEQVPLESTEGGGFAFSLHLDPGLYRLSALADASGFDWDSLYYPLYLFGNTGQVTGPWDFDVRDRNRPLLPSYWVSRDGRRIGLWYLARPSVSDVQNRRLCGRTCFLIEEPGEHRFRFEPYREFRGDFPHMVFEREPDDLIIPVDLRGREPLEANWAWTYRHDEGWDGMRRALAAADSGYAALLDRIVAWAIGNGEGSVAQVPVPTVGLVPLAAGFRLRGGGKLLGSALACIEAQLSRPAWGNPREDGYGHEGDMGAAFVLRDLALAYNWLYEHLGGLRERLRDALRLHGDRFLHNAFLQKDYWGGSVLQDHGFQSIPAFGSAAFAMLGHLPEAEKWLAFAVQRVLQSVEALPLDGVIPLSSYERLAIYTDNLTLFREGMRHATGKDILDRPTFSRTVDFLERALDPETRRVFGTSLGNQGVPFAGGAMFLNCMASKFRDGRPAAMSALLREPLPDSVPDDGSQWAAHYSDVLGLLSYDPEVPPAPLGGRKEGLVWYEDSGVVLYHDRGSDLTLHARCGAHVNYAGYRRVTGPCDRIAIGPLAGHFALIIGGKVMLLLPERGYRTATNQGNCMLIDDKGQYGDIGYTMSLPQWTHRGEQIDVVRWDEVTGTGWARLNLAPAYPREAEVLSYTRDFLFFRGQRRMVCRDAVVLAAPKKLTWNFHTYRYRNIERIGKGTYEMRDGDTVLRVQARGIPLPEEGGVEDTEVVWGYKSEIEHEEGSAAFHHVSFHSPGAVPQAVTDFEFTW